MSDIFTELSLVADVESAKQGDQQAFTRLINQTRNTVTSIALAIVKDLDHSEDIAQQVFITIWKNLTTLKNSTSFLPWLRQVTRYTSYNFIRDNKISKKLAGEEADQVLLQFADINTQPDQHYHREQQSLIINNFIEQLPDESREIVLLYYREEQSSKQVAILLGLQEANVRKKLSRVRELLKSQILSKYGQVLLLSAPTLALNTLIVSSITSSPVAAASIANGLASGKSSGASKLLALLGGAMIGAFAAIIAVVWSSNFIKNKINNQQAKKQIDQYRNQTIAWIIFSGLLLTAGYELTEGWLAPLSTYIVFAIGLFIQMKKINTFTLTQLYCEKRSDAKIIKQRKLQKNISLISSILGLLAGFSGLIIGLLNSGRLVL